MRPRPSITSIYAREHPYFIPYIMGLCRQAARLAEWTNAEWIAFHDEAMAADDDAFLEVVVRFFDVAGRAS